MGAAPAPTYLSPRELSARWENRVAVKTLANWRCSGVGPTYRRFGNKILYPVSSVEQWEKDRESNGTNAYKGTA